MSKTAEIAPPTAPALATDRRRGVRLMKGRREKATSSLEAPAPAPLLELDARVTVGLEMSPQRLETLIPHPVWPRAPRTLEIW
jgi:hypothetical protein